MPSTVDARQFGNNWSQDWMFLGNDEAGPRAAVLCTIIAGAKRLRRDSWAYLHDVILRLSADASPEMMTWLLPDRWALAPRARLGASPRGIATEGAASRPAASRSAAVQVTHRAAKSQRRPSRRIGPSRRPWRLPWESRTLTLFRNSGLPQLRILYPSSGRPRWMSLGFTLLLAGLFFKCWASRG